MALKAFTRKFIEQPVAQRNINGTVFLQKARVLGLSHRQAPDKTLRVVIALLVSLYAANDTDYKTPLSGAGLAPYVVELVADNDTIVDATSGQILAIRVEGTPQTDWLAQANAYEQEVLFQGDFFLGLRDNVAVVEGEMIGKYIQLAPASKFGA